MFLLNQVDTLFKGLRMVDPKDGSLGVYRKKWKEGCATRVYHRARAMMEEVKKNEAAALSFSGSKALVVAGYFEKLRAENNAAIEARGGFSKGRASRPKKWSEAGAAGFRAGDAVKLRKDIG